MKKESINFFIFLTLSFGLSTQFVKGSAIASYEYGQSPSSAQLVTTNLGPYNALLNTSNTAISFSESLCESSVIEAGWANIANGAVIEFTFAHPVFNFPGADFYFFEARYDAGTFNFSSNYDGFSSQADVGAFSNTGLTRNYYVIDTVGVAGPYTASVFVAGIDLSLLGIPTGEPVTKIRIISTNTGGDPLGLVAVPEPSTALLCGTGILALAACRRQRKS